MEDVLLCFLIHKRKVSLIPLRYILELLDDFGADKADCLARAVLRERILVLWASFCPAENQRGHILLMCFILPISSGD